MAAPQLRLCALTLLAGRIPDLRAAKASVVRWISLGVFPKTDGKQVF